MNFRQWLEGLEPGPQQMVTPNGPNPMQVPINPNLMIPIKKGQTAQYQIKKPQPLGTLNQDFPGTARPPFAEK
jgi:hypothetical protein